MFIGVNPQCYTLVNSVLRISIALSIESFWTYTVVSSAKTTMTGRLKTTWCPQTTQRQGINDYSSSLYHLYILERERDQQEFIPVEHLYLNLMMLIGSDSWIYSEVKWTSSSGRTDLAIHFQPRWPLTSECFSYPYTVS